MQIKPLYYRIVVKQDTAEEVSKGGIHLPHTAQEKPQQGTVMAVGPGRFADNGEIIPMTLKACDAIIYAKYTGSEIAVDGENYIIMRESDVLAIV